MLMHDNLHVKRSTQMHSVQRHSIWYSSMYDVRHTRSVLINMRSSISHGYTSLVHDPHLHTHITQEHTHTMWYAQSL